jgi:DNA-binding LacI/PurR family transcriptional regulator
MLRYKEIKNMLTAEVAKLNGNDRLPSRRELCEKLDTSKATLGKAINELVAEGVLYSRGGSGTYVAGGTEGLSVYEGQSWGVIVPDVAEEFYAKIVRGVENVAQSYGINLILCNSDYNLDKQEQYIKRLNNSGVSGIIIVPIASRDIRDNIRLNNQLTEIKVPFVFCSRNTEGINAPIVAPNYFYGGYIATKHLLKMGYRNIAYISQYNNRSNIERSQGYIAALQKYRIEVNRNIMQFENKGRVPLIGYDSMKKILASGEIVDAVFSTSDDFCQGIYKAIVEAGLVVSDDVGVVGYNNADLCEKLTPALTTVDYKNLEIGTKAAEVLYKQIHGEPLTNYEFYLFQPELVVRDSCLGLKKK